jgi:hypothetical protein
MKGIIPWLVLWACLAGTSDFCSAQNKIFFLTVHYFNTFAPNGTASWAGSHAGSPVS